jgi:heme/copper-type cytochrome/quinol oxidase subunit 1
MLSKLAYQVEVIQAFFSLFFVAVNLTFFPMHFIGLQGAPRKYKQLPDKYRHLVRVSTFGATMGAMRMWMFMTMYTETMISYRII